MAKKRVYIVRINGGAKRGAQRYQYSYAGTKGIGLELSARSATVSLSLWSAKNALEFGTSGCRLYDDLLYKVSLAWLLCYGRIVSISSVTVQVGDASEVVVYDVGKVGRGRPPFAALDYTGTVSLPSEFMSESVMGPVLSIARTRTSHRMAALSALLLAKMRRGGSDASDIVERFSCSWTALNGYYSFVASLARPGKQPSDRDKMGISLKLHGLGDCAVTRSHSAQLARVAIETLRDVQGVREPLTTDEQEKLELLTARIQRFTDKDGGAPYEKLTLYGYLLFCLPYYFRCQLLHGEKPLSLFVYRTDERMWVPPILSDIIEAFLDKNLWKLFDGDELEAIEERVRGL